MKPTCLNPVFSGWATACIAQLDEQSTRHDVAFQGGRMCWRKFGSGRPLVLVHGGHGSWMHWVRNIEALAERFTVWVPDLPGYGESDNPEQPDLSSLVEATIATLDQLLGATTDIDVAGFSFGGLVAAHLAARRKRVGKLVLLGPVGHGTRRRPVGLAVPWKSLGDDQELAQRMKHNLAIQMIHFPEHIDALAVMVHTDSCLRNRFRSKTFSRGNSLFEALDRHDGELLLIWGEHDVTADPAVLAHSLVSSHPQRRAHIVKDAGHWVQFEHPTETNRLMLDWLTAESMESHSASQFQPSGE